MGGPRMEEQVTNPLEQLTLEQLRQRTSAKWRLYPPDVLPMWVAEMDVLPAEPVAAALRHALDIGDTGYSVGSDYAQAVKAFATQRWGWDGFPAETAKSVPDVMMGIVEVLRLITEPGDPVVVNPPVYPPFYAFVTSAGRTVVEAPLTAAGRIDLDRLQEVARTGGNTFAANIALKWNEAGPIGLSALIASGLILFIITLVVNMIARAIIAKHKEFSGANS